MKAEPISGIYLITCLPTGKVYIGSSKNIKMRFYMHKSLLRKKRHHNPHLQAAVDKYGLDEFTFEIWEKCPLRLLIERESYWIKAFNNCEPLVGFNIASDTKCPARGLKWSNEYRLKKVKVYFFLDPKGVKVQVNDLKEFAKIQNFSQSGYESLQAVLYGKRFSLHGWRKYDPTLEGKQFVDIRKGRTNTKLAKAYKVLAPDGKIISFTNLSEFCKKHHLSSGNLAGVLSGAKWKKSCKGFRKV